MSNESQPKFTPGPWIAVGMGSEGYNIYTDDFGKPFSEQRFHGAIAQVHGGEWKTLVANAQLISTAPELLEALEGLLKNYAYNNGKGLGAGPIFKAKQAIAKAKGLEL